MKEFEFYGNSYKLELFRARYVADTDLAVLAFCDGEPFADVTVNLGVYDLEYDEAFVDEHNCPGITDWLRQNGIAEYVDEYGSRVWERSGFNTYYLMRFDLTKIPLLYGLSDEEIHKDELMVAELYARREEEAHLASEEYVIESVVNGNFQQARELMEEYEHGPLSVIKKARELYGEEVAAKVENIILY